MWEGGDPGCDHVRLKRGDLSTIDGGHYQCREIYRDVCGKCGASRIDSQIGLEQTPDLYVEGLVRDVFGPIKDRVLRDDGVLFVNLGDTWGRGTRGRWAGDNKRDQHGLNSDVVYDENLGESAEFPELNRIGIPERFVLAMQAAGWVWRDTIVWEKASPMPSSVNGWRWQRHRIKIAPSKRGEFKGHEKLPGARDGKHFDSQAKWEDCPGCEKCRGNNGLILRKGSWRTTAGHEYIYMFTKGEEYFCDAEAIREMAVTGKWAAMPPIGGVKKAGGDNPTYSGNTPPGDGMRNPRSVWRLTTEPLKHKHFAAFPTELPRRLIQVATSEKGYCAKCGEPWCRVVETTRVPSRPGTDSKVNRASADPESPYHQHNGMTVGNRDPMRHVSRTRTLGWRPTCNCNCDETVPATVLDPFLGSGSTAIAACQLGRNCIGLELNPEYVEMARQRIGKALRPTTARVDIPDEDAPLFTGGD